MIITDIDSYLQLLNFRLATFLNDFKLWLL